MPKRLGELLTENGIITKEQLLAGLKYQKETGAKLGEALLATGVIKDEDIITEFLSRQLECEKISLRELELDPSIVQLIPPDVAFKFNIIAIHRTSRILTVAISDAKNLFALDAVKFLTGCTVKPVIAPAQEIKDAIKINYKAEEEPIDDVLGDIKAAEEFEVVAEEKEAEVDDISNAVSDAPVVKLVNHLITEAVKRNASDIHIETYQRVLRARYRIDGNLIEISSLPYRLRPSIISRIKIMASLDISEKRLPQDGRIKIKTGMETIDIRVSTIPTIYGEKVVMRILNAANLVLDINKLGIPEPGRSQIIEAMNSPFGMFLVTGPTGSGKTTTLYSALCMLNKPDVNIMTAEDPVEYNIDGINQVTMNSEIGLTFAASLRSFLRQDPDIILVGEIRDLETAEIGIKAALTGHLVFSTLHTNNSVATIARLADMGVEPFLIASSVKVIVAQRLVRRICSNCKTPVTKDIPETARVLGIKPEALQKITMYQGKGCALCGNTGYKGRCGLYEVLPITPDIQEMIISRASPLDIEQKALKLGMKSLRIAAIERLAEGATTVEEILGATER
jgi:type IV pilus assembly protein PilB